MESSVFCGGGGISGFPENGKHDVKNDNDINIMGNNDYSRYSFILTFLTLAIDLVICVITYLFFCRQFFDIYSIRSLQSALLIAVLYSFCLIQGGVVLHRRKVMDFNVFMIIMRNTVLFAVLSALLLKLGRFLTLPILWLLLYYLVVGILSLTFRFTLRYFVKKLRMTKRFIRHVVFVGTSNNNVNLLREMGNTIDHGLVVDGYFDDAPCDDMPEDCPYLGKPDNVIKYLEENATVTEVYYGKAPIGGEESRKLIRYCLNHIVRCYIVPNVEDSFRQRMYYNTIGSAVYLSFFRDPLMSVENRLLKRAFDVVVSSIFLVTLFPIVFLVVGIISSITMPGPIFFRQKRTGVNGKDFYCLKFRSMKVNKEADSMQATKNDPRKTKWGNIMRKTNIDELPQFINVLMGDMSVVGPRPHMLRHTEEYSQLIDKYMMRHFIKPGITGWSQVTGYRGETKELSQMEGRIRGDIWYVEHWSIWLDMYIMLKTIANLIIGDKNAY